MAWCAANGFPEAALHYGHAAGETEAVTRLVEQLMFPTYFGGGVATLETWLAWYDDAQRARHPTIAVLGAWICYLTGRPAEGARWERAARQSTATPELPDGSATIEPWIATLRAYTCPDELHTMLADARLALRELGPEGWWRPVAQLAEGCALALLGDAERARDALLHTLELTAVTGAADEGSAACAQLALLAIEAGAWEEAAAHAAQGMRLVEGARLDDYLACALAIAVAARVAVQQGDTTRASECIAKVHRLRPLLNPGLSWLSVQTGLELKGVHLALGSRRSPPRSGARPRRSCACALALACWPTRGASCAPA